MRAFRARLVQALLEEPRALSRNRHFDTFDHPAGRAALRSSRYLRSLEREILAAVDRGDPPKAARVERDGVPALRIEFRRARGKQEAYLSMEEVGALLRRPGIRAALGLGDESSDG